MKQKDKLKCATALDFVEAVQKDHVYPVMYCHMRITGKLDIGKLKESVRTSGMYIPELFCAYDFRHHRFVRRGFTLKDIIQAGDTGLEPLPAWDLSSQPQLKIIIGCKNEEIKLIFGMSHLVSDGAGFLQYLYLLAALYNGTSPESGLQNERKLSRLFQGIRVQPRTEQTRYGKTKPVHPLLPCSRGKECYLIKRRISSEDFQKLHQRAQQHQATMNDIFMAAYAHVIARMQDRESISIACPADLRSFRGVEEKGLTVANMTGLFRNIVIECGQRYDFTSIVRKVHIEMELQKSRRRCFAGILLLNKLYSVIPHGILGKMVRSVYRPLSVSYTNIGVIQHETLMFRDCDIIDCMITGSYRHSPDFQLTVSTFRDVCTLNCTLVGDAETKEIAERILDQVVRELLEWTIKNFKSTQ